MASVAESAAMWKRIHAIERRLENTEELRDLQSKATCLLEQISNEVAILSNNLVPNKDITLVVRSSD